MPFTETLPNGRDAGTERRHRLIRLGLIYTLALLVIATIAGFSLSRLLHPAERRTFALFFEENVNGLYPGSRVQAHGVPVGKVESLRLRPPSETGGHFYAEVRVALDVRCLRQLNPKGNFAEKGDLEHAVANLRAKRILLSPLAAEYGIELIHDTPVPAQHTARAADAPPEIPVLTGFLTGEKLSTYADTLAEFSRNDFAKLEQEWNATLDRWLAISNLKNPAKQLAAITQKLAAAKHHLDAANAPARLAAVNLNLENLRLALNAAAATTAVQPATAAHRHSPSSVLAIHGEPPPHINATANAETTDSEFAAIRKTLAETRQALAALNAALDPAPFLALLQQLSALATDLRLAAQ